MIRNIIRNPLFRKKKKIVVLAYHRIDQVDADPWRINVTPKNFCDHLSVMKSKFDVIDFSEFKKQLDIGIVKDSQILITFDDAYSDNYRNAMPLLEKYNLPATFFVPTSYVGRNGEFWNDILVEIILHAKKLPKHICINTKNVKFDYDVQKLILSDSDSRDNDHWKVGQKMPNERCKLYLKIWEVLRPLEQSEIDVAIDQLKLLLPKQYWENKLNFPMNFDELKNISENELFDIGMHTDTHISLSNHSFKIQSDEIIGCKNQLEKELCIKMDSIAYPYGDFNDVTLTVLNNHTNIYGFTCEKRTISAKTPKLKLGRFQPLNVDGKVFEKQLKNWFYYTLVPFFALLNNF